MSPINPNCISKQQTHQSVQPYGSSSGNLYGGNAAGHEYLYGQSSSLHPMYQSSLQQQSEYVFPGISSSHSSPFTYGNYGSPSGKNNAQVILSKTNYEFYDWT